MEYIKSHKLDLKNFEIDSVFFGFLQRSTYDKKSEKLVRKELLARTYQERLAKISENVNKDLYFYLKENNSENAGIINDEKYEVFFSGETPLQKVLYHLCIRKFLGY
ncbi:MAG: hypothetical protein RsTaC01_0502 [Candidatus Paraimprobicoccus trichonymphae]|uniref:Uncharacterized protein n=1 Tax=Candidatus Paraimprobicoccus trichonymphae TaxID=3033793 RepID=A0AA48KXQ6_9FIRM|nr:MAG: hypothetical protein RsTaC01_0502 [Candidatus Paraimprobicoccus trichonymphae]